MRVCVCVWRGGGLNFPSSKIAAEVIEEIIRDAFGRFHDFPTCSSNATRLPRRRRPAIDKSIGGRSVGLHGRVFTRSSMQMTGETHPSSSAFCRLPFLSRFSKPRVVAFPQEGASRHANKLKGPPLFSLTPSPPHTHTHKDNPLIFLF